MSSIFSLKHEQTRREVPRESNVLFRITVSLQVLLSVFVLVSISVTVCIWTAFAADKWGIFTQVWERIMSNVFVKKNLR